MPGPEYWKVQADLCAVDEGAQGPIVGEVRKLPAQARRQ